ncbi:hypothetical protein [Undibacterium parvum]|uniref:Uncharacterized protein n=1 Tax=Undibacterium parvum TaxID=401471 RepID=A0A3Q9BQ05_9BURK|nr:hypothetical protein [Undibacterium parvum]AZP11886.1 hypothetical protein EJN92_07650 [Undibacterium parvum]
MNDNSTSKPNAIPDSLAEMLPVGMLANGGLAADAMAAIANRRHAVAGWEAFHYERISESEFEITGGMLVMAGNSKKWPGPHDCVSITEAEILQEMRAMLAPAVVSLPPTPASTLLPAASSALAAGLYLQVQLALPEDEAGRQRILKAFHLQADFFGAKVLACSLHDSLN